MVQHLITIENMRFSQKYCKGSLSICKQWKSKRYKAMITREWLTESWVSSWQVARMECIDSGSQQAPKVFGWIISESAIVGEGKHKKIRIMWHSVFQQGSINWAALGTWINFGEQGEHGDHGEHLKDGKHRPDDLKEVCDKWGWQS